MFTLCVGRKDGTVETKSGGGRVIAVFFPAGVVAYAVTPSIVVTAASITVRAVVTRVAVYVVCMVVVIAALLMLF